MSLKSRLAKLANVPLRLVGAKIVRHHVGASKPWDDDFRSWIVKAQAEGKDPNDIGDFDWDDDPLKESLERFYYPYIEPTSVVLELGPGSGRATRHIIGRCREMVLVDYSKFVCEFLNGYLAGKGKFQTAITSTARPCPVSPATPSTWRWRTRVFEHIGKDDMFFFLEDFHRVLETAWHPLVQLRYPHVRGRVFLVPEVPR